MFKVYFLEMQRSHLHEAQGMSTKFIVVSSSLHSRTVVCDLVQGSHYELRTIPTDLMCSILH